MNLDGFKFTIISTVFIFLCYSSAGQSKHNLNHAAIVGKWVIDHFDKTRDFDLIIAGDSSKNLITMFGVEIWSLAIGKDWIFHENGILTTNIHINNPTFSPDMAEWTKMAEDIDFSYKLDSTLTILMYFENQLVYESHVEIISLNHTEMIWDIEGFYKVTLIKEEK